jgi:hypothetical protein
MLLFIVLCSTASFTKSTRYDSAFAVFYFTYNGAMFGSNLRRMTQPEFEGRRREIVTFLGLSVSVSPVNSVRLEPKPAFRRQARGS